MASEIRILINAKGVVTGTKEVETHLKKVSNSAKTTGADLNKALKVDVKAQIPQLAQFSKGLSGISNGLGLVAKGGVAGAVLLGFGKFALHAAERAEELENSLLGLTTVAKNTGNDIDFAKNAAKQLSSDGLIPLADTAASLKNLMASGLSIDQSIKLFNSLKDSAAFNRQGFLSMGEAVKGATEGIKNGNSILVDNAGVTKNLSIMQKEYAASLGKTVGQLTDAEKIQAAYVGILKEAEKFTGDAARAADTYTGAKARLSTAIDRATASLGSFITQSSLVKGTLNFISEGIENLGYVGLDASEKVKILEKDLANFQPGLDLNANERKQSLINEIARLKEVVELEKMRSYQGEYDAKVKREQIEQAKKLEAENLKAMETEQKRIKEVEKLKKQLIDAGKTELQVAKDVRDRRLALVKGDADAQALIWKDFYDTKKKLDEKNVKDSNKLAKDSLKEIIEMQKAARDIMQEFAANPLGGSDTLRDLKSARQQLIDLKGDGESEELFGKIKELDGKISAGENARSFGVGAGLANSVVGGKAGAQGLVSSAAALGLDALAPGLGQAAKPLLDAFTQGPDAVKAMVNEFADALPDVIIGFVEAIPVFIETLVDRAPDIIQRLVEKAPAIITKIIADLPRITAKVITLMPKIAIEFAKSFVQNVPMIVGEIARGVYDAITGILSGSGGGVFGSGGGVSGFFEDANDWVGNATGFKFARGGRVPDSSGTAFRDSVPAVLMGGERVLDRNTNAKFERFVDSGGSGGMDLMLNRILELLQQPMTVQSAVQVDNRAFANIMLQVSRTKQRTS